MSPRSNAASTTALARSGERSANSNASIEPRPRTSPISGWRAAMSSRRARSVSPSSRARREELRLGHDVENGERGGARERVAAERPAEAAGRDRVHDLGAAGDAGEREAAADRLPEDGQVRLGARVLLDRPHRPRAPDAGLHLVVHPQDPVLAAELLQAPGSPAASRGTRPRPAPARGRRTRPSTGRRRP